MSQRLRSDDLFGLLSAALVKWGYSASDGEAAEPSREVNL
jgi:hypothetical protein